ncbi:MAG: sulfatase-like hydrolase/transferase [Acidobacteria bacterium]|nr:sulfatase-like hydrolase/transferase [Acidobacteriota bacterium]
MRCAPLRPPVRACLVALAAVASLAAKPNIVLIVADDLGYAELGCQGAKDLPTPRIDSIAAGGVRFTNGYVTAPVCCPSRAGFLTGRMQTRFGHERNAIGVQNLDAEIGLPLDQATLADLLKPAGYKTALVGKWHLGAHPTRRPHRRGFDEFFGFLNEGHYYVPQPYEGVWTWLRIAKNPYGAWNRLQVGPFVFSDHMGSDEPTYDLENPLRRGDDPVSEPEYLTDALAREAVDFIDRNKRDPFFLYLAFNAPHSPMQAADAYMERFRDIEDIHRRIFVSMVANLDDAVGRVLDKLEAEGLTEDTLIFFLSDNGGPTKELTSSNAPLREGKGQVYEGGLRVPFLAQWKGRWPEGKIDARPASSLDIVPTALAAAGAPLPDGLDGVDLTPWLTGERNENPHDVLFWRYIQRIALRRGDWKVVARYDAERGPHELELYNLAADLGETTDLAAREPERLETLRRLLGEYDAQMVDSLWGADPRSRSTRTNVPLEALREAEPARR